MRNLTTILFLSFTIILNSCNDDSPSEKLEELPIAQALSNYFFDFDEDNFTEEIRSHFDEPYTVNSENDMPEIFRILNLEIPDDLKNIDYNKYSLVLLFSFHVEQEPGILHKFYKNIKSDYEYLYSQSYKSFNYSENSLLFYYTGIVVNKIPDDSKIVFRSYSY